MELLLTHQQRVERFTLSEPGALIGSELSNAIHLPAEMGAFSPYHLAIRINNGQPTITALSLHPSCYLDDQLLPLKQSVIWPQGTVITAGHVSLQWTEKTEIPTAASTPLAAVVTSAESTALTSQPARISDSAAESTTLGIEDIGATEEDPFSDLISSPGVIPVGGEPLADTHPFAIDNALQRNSADPLGQLNPKGLTQNNDQLLSLLK